MNRRMFLNSLGWLALATGLWLGAVPCLAAQQPYRNFNLPPASQRQPFPVANPVFAPNVYNQFNPNMPFQGNRSSTFGPSFNPGFNPNGNANFDPNFNPNAYFNPNLKPVVNPNVNPNLYLPYYPAYYPNPYLNPAPYPAIGVYLANPYLGFPNPYLLNNPYWYYSPVISNYTGFGRPAWQDLNANPPLLPGPGAQDPFNPFGIQGFNNPAQQKQLNGNNLPGN